MRGKRGANILIENIIFIVLNLVFLSILVLFLFLKMGSAAVLEEKYSKQIAMIIDSAKPEMEIYFDMEEGIEKAKDKVGEREIVSIQDNVVTVRLREKGGYSYSFFNDVEIDNIYPSKDEPTKMRIKITGYKNE